jgi:hypothetical protein
VTATVPFADATAVVGGPITGTLDFSVPAGSDIVIVAESSPTVTAPALGTATMTGTAVITVPAGTVTAAAGALDLDAILTPTLPALVAALLPGTITF